MGPFLRTVAVASAIAMVGTACDDDKTALTKAEWIKAAAAVCVAGSAEFNTLFETDFPTTPAATQDFLTKAAPVVEDEVEALRALGTPDEDGDEINAAIARGEAAIEDLEEAAKDPGEAGEIFESEGGDNLVAFEAEMKELGVPECDPDDAEEEAEEDLPDPSTFSEEKAAYVAAADAVCTETNEVLRPAEDEFLEDFPPPLENWSGFLAVANPAIEELLDAMEALDPPAEDAAALSEILASQRELLDDLRTMQEAADAGDQKTFDEVSGPVFTTFEEIDLQLRAYGFQVCGAEEDDPPEA